MSAPGVLAVLYRAQIMVKGRFSGRFSPVVLKVEAVNEKAARALVRKLAAKIGTPGEIIELARAEVQS